MKNETIANVFARKREPKENGNRAEREVKCTGWRRLIGFPKLQIIFHKRDTKYRSLLRKMTYKDKGSYESSPPCMNVWESERARAREEDDQLFWCGVSKKPYVLFPKSFVFWLGACAEERKTDSVLKCHDAFICAMTHSFVP